MTTSIQDIVRRHVLLQSAYNTTIAELRKFLTRGSDVDNEEYNRELLDLVAKVQEAHYQYSSFSKAEVPMTVLATVCQP